VVRARTPSVANVLALAMGGPTVIAHGTEEQRRRFLPPILSADEIWCQGFSEPGAGSDLAALKTRAVRDGEEWVVTGQKVWTTFAHHAKWCMLVARTDPDAPKHKGLTYFLMDMEQDGVQVRPLRQITGESEFNELFIEDARIPDDNIIGGEGDGWAVAMDLLPFERSTSLWHRAAFLHRRLQDLVAQAPSSALDPTRLGEVTQLLYAFRARSRATQHRMARGERLGPETSIDKVLLATTEQAVFELVGEALPAEVAVGDDPTGERWRTELLYSRAASIYGGSAEIQRNIIARRLLDLGSES